MHFSMELSKKLDIWYRNPPLPVDLTITGGGGGLNEAMLRAAAETEPLMRRTSAGGNSDSASDLDLKDLQSKFRPQLDWQR